MNNTTRFFTLIEKKATLLQSCLLLRYFNIVRLKRLNELISSSRANDEVRLTDLTNLFALDSDDETRDYLEQFGYAISATAPPCLLVPSAINRDPPNIAVRLSQKLINSKYKGNLKDVSDAQNDCSTTNFPLLRRSSAEKRTRPSSFPICTWKIVSIWTDISSASYRCRSTRRCPDELPANPRRCHQLERQLQRLCFLLGVRLPTAS